MVCVCPRYDNSHGRQDDDKPSTFGSNLFLLMLSPPMAKNGVTTYGYLMKIAMKSIYIPQNGFEQNLYTHDTFL